MRAFRAFAANLPDSVQLGGKAEEARLEIVAKSDAWLKEQGVV